MVDIIVGAEGLFIYALIAAIIIQALLTWFVPMGAGRFSALLYDLTNPLLAPIRRLIPPLGSIDLSPLIAIILLQFLLGPLLIGATDKLAGR